MGSPGRRRLRIGVRSFLTVNAITQEGRHHETPLPGRRTAGRRGHVRHDGRGLAVQHGRRAPGTPALTASALSDRYTAEARAIKTAERAAIRHRDSQLASALARLAPRQVLFFNPNGQGVAAMVIGNLATATRVAILVPGSDTTP